MERSTVIDWLASLTPKQFTEVFYESTSKMDLSDDAGTDHRFVLFEFVRFMEDNRSWSSWEHLMVCPSKSLWDDDAPVCQQGTHCGCSTISWDKYSVCPLCGGEVFGT